MFLCIFNKTYRPFNNFAKSFEASFMHSEKLFQLYLDANFSYSFTVPIFLDKLIISSMLGGVFLTTKKEGAYARTQAPFNYLPI